MTTNLAANAAATPDIARTVTKKKNLPYKKEKKECWRFTVTNDWRSWKDMCKVFKT